MALQERGAEQMQRYLLVSLQLHQPCGGEVSALSRGPRSHTAVGPGHV